LQWAAQEQIKIMSEGSRKGNTVNFIWFTLPQGLRPVFFTPQAKKDPLN